jgi:hypothetical protein
MKVSIMRNDLADAMLTHEDGGMRIVKEVTGQQWKFTKDLLRDIGVPVGRNEDIQSWRF